MNGFHGQRRQRSYFEGWYLKHQNKTETVAVIPAYHVDDSGRRSASIQVISSAGAWNYNFPAEAFSARRGRFAVKIGENVFCETGMTLHLKNPDISGALRYGALAKPRSDVMGPFRFVPGMQCRHGLLSHAHRVDGELLFGSRVLDYSSGLGYLETDRGSSFPRRYVWTQCCWEEKQPCSIMISVAHIPMLGSSFPGCIGSVYYEGREYRLTTYSGAKIMQWDASSVILQQGKFLLQADVLEQPKDSSLMAPVHGGMTRSIRESPACRMRYRFSETGRLIFELVSSQASFEFADETETSSQNGG